MGLQGVLSPPPSSARRPRGKEALGGWCRSDAGQPAMEEQEVVAIIGLRLLKTGPSAESSSDSISTTPFSSSRGGRAGDA